MICIHLYQYLKNIGLIYPWNFFFFGLPRFKKGKDSIFVVVDRFFMMTLFISSNKIDDETNIANLFI
jgi:hypothetical protein